MRKCRWTEVGDWLQANGVGAECEIELPKHEREGKLRLNTQNALHAYTRERKFYVSTVSTPTGFKIMHIGFKKAKEPVQPVQLDGPCTKHPAAKVDKELGCLACWWRANATNEPRQTA